ncbi:MAG: CpaF family protein [Firmicutes bacterium]|nr:CpaF family protein [Bacillota bacterium]
MQKTAGAAAPAGSAPRTAGAPWAREPEAAPEREGGAAPGTAAPWSGVDPELKARVKQRLAEELDAETLERAQRGDDRPVKEAIAAILRAEGASPLELGRLTAALYAEVLGFGPIQPLLDDPDVSEIMINGPRHVYVERHGRLQRAPVRFEDDEAVLRLIERIVAPLGRRIDEASPMVDARLPDGSRVNAIIPPLAIDGPAVTIRKFARDPFGIDDLIRFGTLTPEMAEVLRACVQARLNILVSGSTGSGKTTTLNVLSSFIPPDERIVTIEDAAELQLRQEHVVRLETRPPNLEGRGEIAIRQLVRNALRMRPDRIVVGEVRGGEALDMLQAMNTGHDGSLTTVHANSPRDALSRLETMVLMAGMDLPVRAIREQIASALDLIVHQARLRDGTRKILYITEVQGLEGDVIVLQDVFRYVQTGVEDGRVRGDFRATGVRPRFSERLAAAGIVQSTRTRKTERRRASKRRGFASEFSRTAGWPPGWRVLSCM